MTRQHWPWQVRRKVVPGDMVQVAGYPWLVKVLRVRNTGKPQRVVYDMDLFGTGRVLTLARDQFRRAYWSEADDGSIVSVEP